MSDLVLAIDQGTTSTRALVLGRDHVVRGLAQIELPQHYPASGSVEHDAEDIWSATLATMREALARAGVAPAAIAGIGITNQRETCVIWDRRTGKPIHRAIVWQDRRTADLCARLKAEGVEPLVTQKTGLLLDPYFSGTKLAWLLDNVPGARASAEAGHLAAGTIDAFLIWRLTEGRVHATDATNASRTLLFDIHAGAWDDELLRILRIPRALLPDVRDCAADFGTTTLLGGTIAIRGVAGDQQAATIGQGCFQPGMVKSTYGTGCFALLNTGTTAVASNSRLLTTVAYQLDGRRTYALEGAIFIAGAAVQWLRDGLKLIDNAAQSGDLAARADPTQNVVLVPAFVGLGAPHWNAEARGALLGITRNTGAAEIARAALESVAYQTADLLDAMRRDWPGHDATVLRVDGGMAASDWTMQLLADVLDAPVDRPAMLETTALGAAWLAGMHAGVWPGPEETARAWAAEKRFTPSMTEKERRRRLDGWRRAVKAALLFAGTE
ncbi:MAG: glycerol kinase GlpK [Hyphomicrobiaceae bacterium]